MHVKDLAAREASFGYGRGFAVERLSLEIPRGRFTALIGANGSGKSTLLRALAGLLPLTSGSVRLGGCDIATLARKEVARCIGMLPQAPGAPDGLTVEALVEQGRYPHRPLFGRWSQADTAACRQALAVTDMTSLAKRSLESLSGGQRQRAWIAMALAQQTPILLLDEPTSYLDLAHQIDVLELLRDLADSGSTTIVAVLHDINQASRYADHMVLVKDGRVYAEGSPDTVVTAATMKEVFGIDSRVVPDPVSGTPMCVVLPRHMRA